MEYPHGKETGNVIIGGYFIDELKIYVFSDGSGITRAIKFNYDKKIWEEVAKTKLHFDDFVYAMEYDNNQLYLLTDKKIYYLNIK